MSDKGALGNWNTLGECSVGDFGSSSGWTGVLQIAIAPDGENVYGLVGGSSVTPQKIAVFDRDPISGALTQKEGAAGLVGEVPKSLDVDNLEISPDGGYLYAGNVAFRRDPDSGELSPMTATEACVSHRRGPGACAFRFLAISGDGTSAYAAGSDSPDYDGDLMIFERDVATGQLVQRPGEGGCFSAEGDAGYCRKGVGLSDAGPIAVTPDGGNVYAVGGDSLLAFDRSEDGSLTQKPGGAACIGMPDECTFAFAFYPGLDLSVPEDGRNVYVISPRDGAIDILDRETVDRDPAELTITLQPPARISTRKRSVRVGVEFDLEAGSAARCRLDRGRFTPCAERFRANARSRRSGRPHRIEIVTTDDSGNVGHPPLIEFTVVRRK